MTSLLMFGEFLSYTYLVINKIKYIGEKKMGPLKEYALDR